MKIRMNMRFYRELENEKVFNDKNLDIMNENKLSIMKEINEVLTYMCIYIYIHICIYTYVYRIYIQMHIHIHIFTHYMYSTCIYAQAYICIYVHTYTCIQVESLKLQNDLHNEKSKREELLRKRLSKRDKKVHI
jgi:hypothetical protein